MTRNVEYILSLRDKFTTSLSKASKAVDMMDASTSRLNKTITSLMPLITTVGLVRGGGAILKLGMDAEQTNLSFEVMLGSIEKAKKLISDVRAFAIKTPFLYTEVLENTKQLIAYGFTQDEVLSTMKRLGNVAAGLKIPLGDLNYLYGTLKAQGRVLAIDIRQFAMRGIPIYEELAKVLGVTKNKVSELVTEGKVGFEDVEKAFINMSAEGGRFYNLMDRQALMTSGRASNLKDIFVQLGITFGTKYLPAVNKIIDSGMQLAKWMDTNADKIMKVINAVLKGVKLYVMYRASMIAVAAAVRFAGVAHAAYRIAMLAYNRGIQSAIVLTNAFNATMKLNLVGIAITALAAVIMKIRSLREETKQTKDVIEQFGVTQQKINSVIADVNRPFGNLVGRYTNVELQATLDYLQEIYDKTKENGYQTRLVNKETGEYMMQSNRLYKKNIENQINTVRGILSKQGMSGLNAGGISDNRETNITSAAPKVVNININNLIGEQNIATSTLKESTAQIKKLITEALLDGLNDTQIMRAS
jgi:tape measure domain-containing protein